MFNFLPKDRKPNDICKINANLNSIGFIIPMKPTAKPPQIVAQHHQKYHKTDNSLHFLVIGSMCHIFEYLYCHHRIQTNFDYKNALFMSQWFVSASKKMN